MEIRLDYSEKLVYGINCKIPSCLTEVNISPLILLVVRDLLAKSYHLFSLPAEGKLILIKWISRETMFDNLSRLAVWLNIFSSLIKHFLSFLDWFIFLQDILLLSVQIWTSSKHFFVEKTNYFAALFPPKI